jgi:serine/threonine protein kinase
VGEVDDGSIYFVSKFIEGETLAEWMRSGSNAGQWRVIAELVAKAAEALHHAHANQLIHRDIKPGNIMMTTSGNPVIIDFGIALVEENYGKGSELLVGTPIPQIS